MIVTEEFQTVFCNYNSLEKFINSRHAYWCELFDMNLKVDPKHNSTLNEMDILKVQVLVAEKMEIKMAELTSKSRNADLVEAKRFVVNICIGRGQLINTIARTLDYNHATIIHHRKQFANLYETDKHFRERYDIVEDYVLTSLNGRYKDDGSGEKINL